MKPKVVKEGERVFFPIPEPPTREELRYELIEHFLAHDAWVDEGVHHRDCEIKCILTSLYEKYAV